jgi:hypothetical protein
MTVSFVDTSILCNMLPVPGRDQQRDEVIEELREKLAEGETLILPVTAVIETGNFVAQLKDGRAPWRLHEFERGATFLDGLLSVVRSSPGVRGCVPRYSCLRGYTARATIVYA